jgi:hypothetical protein
MELVSRANFPLELASSRTEILMCLLLVQLHSLYIGPEEESYLSVLSPCRVLKSFVEGQ